MGHNSVHNAKAAHRVMWENPAPCIILSQLVKQKVIRHDSFCFHFLITNEIICLFTYLLASYILSIIYLYFAHFFFGLLMFYSLICQIFLYKLVFYSIMIIMCFLIGYVDDIFCINIENVFWWSPQDPHSSLPCSLLTILRGSTWFQKSWLHCPLQLGYRHWQSQSAQATAYDWYEGEHVTQGSQSKVNIRNLAINADTKVSPISC